MFITEQDSPVFESVCLVFEGGGGGNHGVMVAAVVEFTDSYLGAAGRP